MDARLVYKAFKSVSLLLFPTLFYRSQSYLLVVWLMDYIISPPEHTPKKGQDIQKLSKTQTGKVSCLPPTCYFFKAHNSLQVHLISIKNRQTNVENTVEEQWAKEEK